MNNYLFTSKRLGFRNWKITDIELLFEINSSHEVMQFFPSKPTLIETELFISKMQNQFIKNKFCYFAVDILKTKEFIGFIGLSEQTYKTDFNPSIDIGWRLHKKFWNKGYATEGAKACLSYGFNQLKLDKIISVAPEINVPSIAVMQKLGMQKIKNFTHPLLLDFKDLRNCVLYEIKKR